MTDTKDVAYIRERLCQASDVFDEIFVKTKEMSEENKKLKELLKECREWLDYLGIYKYTEDSEDCIKLLNRLHEVLG